MGTPAFAVPVLSALLDAAYDVVGVYSQPDKPAGRGKQISVTSVKGFAVGHGLQVFQPASLRPQRVHQELASLSPEVIVVAAYGLLLPGTVLDVPPLGCLNLHPSLLPRHRGPSPVATTILSGDHATGVTIIKLDVGMDTGPIAASRETLVGPCETTPELTARLFELGASLLIEVLPRWAQGRIEPRSQDDSLATLTRLLSKDDGRIDWALGAAQIERQVRAYQPWPGTYTRWEGKVLKLLEASVAESESAGRSPPGLVMPLPADGLGIATADGVLEVRRLQLEGRRALTAGEFVRGYADFLGSTVG